ncbi:MAG: hypothetical protein EHM35_01010 [Planctomycetaceae bacterium]|nr:MAG: hypothetical protein EHM35_01010 [Planctomycetaceae bacterium]
MKQPKLRRSEVTFTVTCEPDDCVSEKDIRGHFASGDDALDKADADAIIERLRRDDHTAWCGIIVKAEWRGLEATDAVWACTLGEDDTPEQYAEDQGMFDEAFEQLKADVARRTVAFKAGDGREATKADLLDIARAIGVNVSNRYPVSTIRHSIRRQLEDLAWKGSIKPVR